MYETKNTVFQTAQIIEVWRKEEDLPFVIVKDVVHIEEDEGMLDLYHIEDSAPTITIYNWDSWNKRDSNLAN